MHQYSKARRWSACVIGVMEVYVTLIAAFRSSASLGLVSLICLINDPRFSMGFRSGELPKPPLQKLQGLKIMYFSTLPLDSGILISALWITVQLFFSVVQVRHFCRLLFRNGLKRGMHSLFTMSRICLWLTLASVHFFSFSSQFLNTFCSTVLSSLWFSLFQVQLLLPHVFLPISFLFTFLEAALCEQPASVAMTFCDFSSIWRKSMDVF